MGVPLGPASGPQQPGTQPLASPCTCQRPSCRAPPATNGQPPLPTPPLCSPLWFLRLTGWELPVDRHPVPHWLCDLRTRLDNSELLSPGLQSEGQNHIAHLASGSPAGRAWTLSPRVMDHRPCLLGFCLCILDVLSF